jgi:hypothetical protein
LNLKNTTDKIHRVTIKKLKCLECHLFDLLNLVKFKRQLVLFPPSNEIAFSILCNVIFNIIQLIDLIINFISGLSEAGAAELIPCRSSAMRLCHPPDGSTSPKYK